MEQVKAHTDGTRSYPTGGAPSAQPAAEPPAGPAWTAPAASRHLVPPPPSAPSPMAEQPPADRSDPNAVLDQLVASVAGANSAILASVDGFGLARSATIADEAAHSAMLAAAVGLAHQLVAMGRGTQLRQLVVDHDAGRMLIWPIGTERVLAVLATTSVDQGRLRQFVHDRATVLVGAAT